MKFLLFFLLFLPGLTKSQDPGIYTNGGIVTAVDCDSFPNTGFITVSPPSWSIPLDSFPIGSTSILGFNNRYIVSAPGTVIYLPHGLSYEPPKNNLLKELTGYALLGMAGMANGYNQAIHAEGGFGDNSEGFWGKEQWKRKYRDYDAGDLREAYPGSKTVLVWTTDAWHLSGAVKNFGLVTGTLCLTIGEKPKAKTILRRALIGGIVYGLASHGTYNQARFKKLL